MPKIFGIRDGFFSMNRLDTDDDQVRAPGGGNSRQNAAAAAVSRPPNGLLVITREQTVNGRQRFSALRG